MSNGRDYLRAGELLSWNLLPCPYPIKDDHVFVRAPSVRVMPERSLLEAHAMDKSFQFQFTGLRSRRSRYPD